MTQCPKENFLQEPVGETRSKIVIEVHFHSFHLRFERKKSKKYSKEKEK